MWVRGAILLMALLLLPRVMQGPLGHPAGKRWPEKPEVALSRGLMAVGAPRDRAQIVARAVQREAALAGVDPALVVAVISVENPDLHRRSQSVKGATGIMQVMPHWFPVWRKRCGSNPTSIDTNICMGVRVLRMHLAEADGSLRHGLLRFNGCLGGPHCRRYPDQVLRRLRTVRLAMNDHPDSTD